MLESNLCQKYLDRKLQVFNDLCRLFCCFCIECVNTTGKQDFAVQLFARQRVLYAR
jgi:hypothetical protein